MDEDIKKVSHLGSAISSMENALEELNSELENKEDELTRIEKLIVHRRKELEILEKPSYLEAAKKRYKELDEVVEDYPEEYWVMEDRSDNSLVNDFAIEVKHYKRSPHIYLKLCMNWETVSYSIERMEKVDSSGRVDYGSSVLWMENNSNTYTSLDDLKEGIKKYVLKKLRPYTGAIKVVVVDSDVPSYDLDIDLKDINTEIEKKLYERSIKHRLEELRGKVGSIKKGLEGISKEGMDPELFQELVESIEEAKKKFML